MSEIGVSLENSITQNKMGKMSTSLTQLLTPSVFTTPYVSILLCPDLRWFSVTREV